MKYLVLSDVHGNRFGLEAVLADAGGDFDTLLCLGDVVGYGANPNECCQLLRRASATCLLGNHDAAVLGRLDTRWFNPTAKTAVEWTSRQLTKSNQSWLASLAPQLRFAADGFEAVHGSLRGPLEEYIASTEIAAASFQLMKSSLCFFGHTHVAHCYGVQCEPRRQGDLESRGLIEGGTVVLQPGRKYLVNPGSCGQPRDGNPLARYAIFDTGNDTIEVRQVEYDTAAARQAILDAGLPPSLGDRLIYGL